MELLIESVFSYSWLVDNALITVYNLARKYLPHRLQDTAINNIMYAVKTPYCLWNIRQ